jgi:transcriptional regulator with XRE-family HTH domain
MSRISDALRAARKAANLTQHGIAEMLGVSQGFVADVERGRRELPVSQRQKLPSAMQAAVIEGEIADLEERLSELRKRKAELIGRK